MGLLELLCNAGVDGDTDFLGEGVRVLVEAVMEPEGSELTGVPKGERAPERGLACRTRCPMRR
jgi:hypothetical protein